jgi:hypothetical protein
MARRSYSSTGRKQQPDGVPVVEFDLDGVTFTGDGSISIMDLAEYARLANLGIDSDNPAGAGIIADVFLGLLGEQTYHKFRAHCRKHGTDDGDLVQILQGVMADATEAAAARPSTRPSDSSDGPPPGPATAKVVSFTRGTVSEQPVEEKPPVVSYG